ncbi:DOPA 4,5-dioxygenase family protein [Halobacteriovorax sp. GB3]|uniref:DOPA 4,5-dioxygenase family protein n=1 Tax=Halobacteriovorax sp. GB3 TaxID=2719615 RepID=UPI00235E0F68|nr:DOPA 4,5-dioxygenase family protein [Halobacteriovorax sp. GB3]MDD0854387.1 DOPA 4,5-dioxygenase family protein [Halobacteriovorax sp. GB3]
MNIESYHAHFYYTEETHAKALSILKKAELELEGIEQGKAHQKPVGPHPVWSCQLLVPVARFEEALKWLMNNREELDIFIHPVTGNDLKDHTDYAMWLGKSYELKLERFK